MDRRKLLLPVAAGAAALYAIFGSPSAIHNDNHSNSRPSKLEVEVENHRISPKIADKIADGILEYNSGVFDSKNYSSSAKKLEEALRELPEYDPKNPSEDVLIHQILTQMFLAADYVKMGKPEKAMPLYESAKQARIALNDAYPEPGTDYRYREDSIPTPGNIPLPGVGPHADVASLATIEKRLEEAKRLYKGK